MNTVKILFVDDQDIRDDLYEYFNEFKIGEITIIADIADTFENGIKKIKENYYDIAILDLCDGEPSEETEREGLSVLKEIQKHSFIPIIFYTGIPHTIQDLKSEIVNVVSKADGFNELEKAITGIIKSNIGLLKSKIFDHVHNELKKYFWDIIDKEKEIFKCNGNDYSLGYLMLRRLSNSLSKQNIKDILGDQFINSTKIHPMEFYIYPTISIEYEAGEIIGNNDEFYILLTPSCDYVEREKKGGAKERKVGKILLAKILNLNSFKQFIDYNSNKNTDNKNKLKSLISNNSSDRYFFLPKTPFINNSVIDFQNKKMVEYEELTTFTRLAKLDDPFAQSMVSSFIRYYNRVGFPDIDSDYVLENL